MKSDVRKRKGGEDTLNERSSTSDARRRVTPAQSILRVHALTHSLILFQLYSIPSFSLWRYQISTGLKSERLTSVYVPSFIYCR